MTTLPNALTREEAWLLELVVEARYPLRVLSSPDIELHLNRPGHGLTIARLAGHLHRLLRLGLVATQDEHRDPTHPSQGELCALLSLPVGMAWPARASRTFGLTREGGAVWEQLALPDWSRFVSASFGTDPNDAEVVAIDRTVVESFVYAPSAAFAPVAGTERWDVLAPWQATYWKTLPSGHRVRYVHEALAPTRRVEAGPERLPPWSDWFTRVSLSARSS